MTTHNNQSQPVSEKEKKKLIEDLYDFEWRGKNLGMIIEDLRYRLFQKEKECRGLQRENDLANIKIGMLKGECHQKEKECERITAISATHAANHSQALIALRAKEEECRRYRKALDKMTDVKIASSLAVVKSIAENALYPR